eukprot:7063809-Pyramimonas_sp.AAC.1
MVGEDVRVVWCICCSPCSGGNNDKCIHQGLAYTRIRFPLRVSVRGQKQRRCLAFGSLKIPPHLTSPPFSCRRFSTLLPGSSNSCPPHPGRMVERGRAEP